MNLHGIVRSAITTVNPDITVLVQVSDGYETLAGGRQEPAYQDAYAIPAQVQSLTFKDLAQLQGLNLNGTKRAIYLYGRFDGVVRSLMKGGDLITVTAGVNKGVWLVVQVLEQWPDWCKVAVTLQPETPNRRGVQT